jgi:hypothetical protein
LHGAAFKAGEVFHTDPGESGELGSAKTGDAPLPSGRQAHLIRGYLRPPGGEEGAEGVLIGLHPINDTARARGQGRPVSTCLGRVFLSGRAACLVGLSPETKEGTQ